MSECPIAPGLPEPEGTRPCGIKGVSDRTEIGDREDGPLDFKDRRIWYAVAAVIIVLIVISYAAGWFSGGPAPTPQ
jgi:hypothetical protein